MAKHYHTLIIRLLVDEQGYVEHGVVVNVNGEPIGQFRHLADLVSLVTRWLEGGSPSTDATPLSGC